MNNLPGYKITNQIYETANSLVYRGLRQENNQPVILKFLKEDYPTPATLIRYKQEYEITQNLNGDGVIKVYGLERYQANLVMILEDFGGESLKILMNSQKFSLQKFLELAIDITKIISEIHQQNVVHKDINPSNIVLNPQTGQIKIIDFGISSVLSRENPTLKNPHVLEGTLAYVSPEQTGRMNRAMDYRTDFYSLGVTFYELLTGQLPCDYSDAMEVVHCHIAKLAVPPHEINSEIPEAVSEIVMKLLAKTAEDRYQTSWGIVADLEECLRQLQTTGRITDLALAQFDISDKFQIPQKLYGREQEVETLLSAFERVSAGTTEIMLVSGYSGIGKSALVQEVYKPITKARGYFIAGKFDQLQRNIPYSAIVKAFQSLIKQLLTESEAQLNTWRQKLLAALGTNGQVLIDVVPEIELIIGRQPTVPQLAPVESQNRFNLVFQNFIKVFCAVEHPLVIFLDDLQWADSATLKLIELMMTDEGTKCLFLIGAYRDNEVSPSHPLLIALEKLRLQEVIINSIILTPLSSSHINNLIADTVNLTKESVTPLAELVVNKTQGNPFFVNQFLKTLEQENLLKFNLQQRCWQWEINEIKAVKITDNLVELMIGKLKKLPDKTQQVLRLAACIGNTFDLSTLAVVNQKSTEETFIALLPALQEELILGTSELFSTAEEITNSQLVITSYKFLHDRVQQAAYALIDESYKQAIHLQIGRLLLQNTSPETVSEEIFKIADHFNLGIELLNDESERSKIAKLNLIAGQKAKAATAYAAATEYLQAGLRLLGDFSWTHQYELTLALYTEATEAAYLSCDFEWMQKLAYVVQNSGKQLLDKIKVYEVRIQAYVSQNKLLDAVNTALEVLKLLGVEFPSQPNPSDIGQALSETAAIVNSLRIEELIDLPQMSDPYKLAAIRILSNIFAPAYISTPALLPLTVCKQVNLSVQYGNTSVSPFAYANYGLLLCGVVGDIDSGYQFGQLAINLLSKLNATEIKAKTLVIVNVFTRPWKEHLKEILEPFKLAYSSGMEAGDLEWAAFSLFDYSFCSYFSSKELTGLEKEMAAYRGAIHKLKQETALNYHEPFWQTVLNLLGRNENPCRIQGEVYDEQIGLRLYQQANDNSGIFYLFLNKIILCYLFKNYSEAIENTAIAEKYLNAVVGLPVIPIFYFYESLVRLAVYSDTLHSEQQEILDKVQANQEKMEKWAHHAPMNYLHKFYLVEAEKHRVLDQKIEAMEMYDRAIAQAQENEYINEEALASELAAKFYLSWGKVTIAQVYMQKAHYSYQVWGAQCKVEDLEAKYPHLLARNSTKSRPKTTINQVNQTITNSNTTTTSNLGTATLDLATVMKASQTISGEIVLSNLLSRLMKIVIENAGAQKGFLILEKAGNWTIEAEGKVDNDDVTVMQSIPINSIAVKGETPQIASTIINYAIRTQEDVVLNNASFEGQFTNDPYIAITRAKSILCTPLLHQGKLIGIFYLENNLTEAAFTTDRLELLKLLSSQIAISIQNAQLYANLQEFNQNLEQLVTQRTEELSHTLAHLKATQSQLVEAEKMASLGGLVAGIAHEINTPVGVGVTVASALAEHTSEFAATYRSGKMKRSDLEEFVDIATQSSNVLLTNLNQAAQLIQSFKQVAVDQSSEERRTVNVRDYLDEILMQLKPKLKMAKHAIAISGDSNITLDSYPGALSQVVTNLLMNSLIHAYDADTIGNIEIHLQQEGNHLILQYADDGKGIPAENLAKIFDPFFTTKRSQGGSGLGLHLVYNLVTQKLKGEIKCESIVGSGTKFAIALPLQIN